MRYLKLLIIAAGVSLMAACCKLPFEGSIDENAPWKIRLESLENPDEVVEFSNADAPAPVVKKGCKGRTVSFKGVGGKDLDIEIKYVKADDGCGLDVIPTITNNAEGWVVSTFWGPELKGMLNGAVEDYSFIAPLQKGHKTDMSRLKEKSDAHKKLGDWDWIANGGFYTSPSYSKMKYFVFEGNGGGLYSSVRTTDHMVKVSGNVRYYPEDDEVSFWNAFVFFAHPGESVTVPTINYWNFEGDWHDAADHYRAWFIENHGIAYHPQWLRNTTGWMLTILKQQNAEVIWPYSTIGREMSDAAEANGFNLLGLFGRAKGGHDRFYPNYESDPEMGGEEEFKKGIEEAHARGMRAIVYSNGQLLDRHGIDSWWEDKGKGISLMNKKGEVYGENFQKFHDGEDRSFTWACMHTQEWHDMLWSFAVQANELGADGLIYDQLGGPSYRRCYARDHGHKSPAYSYGGEMVAALQDIYNRMHEINPEFVFMVEGYCDTDLPYIGISHRGLMGHIYRTVTQANMEKMAMEAGVSYQFPQLATYTFPEIVSTTSNPAPINQRIFLNFCAVFNEKPEIEVRYAPDKDMVLTGKNQTEAAYANIKGPGSGSGPYHLDMVFHGDATASRIYCNQVLGMLKAHADVMYEGKFTDDRGFTLDCGNPLVYAKSYQSGDKLAVIIWNISDKDAATYTVTPAEGYEFAGITAPDAAPALGDAIAPESLHLLIFNKK